MDDQLKRRTVQLLRQDDCIPGAQLAKAIGVSLRSIQSLVREINDTHSGFSIISQKGKGYRLHIESKAQYDQFIHGDPVNDTFTTEERADHILRQLLRADSWKKLDDICESLYMSRSSATPAMKEVRRRLQAARLSLENRPGYGLKVQGSKLARRRCLATLAKEQKPVGENLMSQEEIKTILAAALEKHHLHMDTYSLASLILHIQIMLKRIQSCRYLDEEYHPAQTSRTELAREIAEQLESRTGLKIPAKETAYLEILLTCRRLETDAASPTNIIFQQDILDLAEDMLERIWEDFSMDLRKDLDLQILLCQHLAPLKSRVFHNMQTANPMREEIIQEYPLAFEMAASASGVFRDEFDKKLTRDEMSLLAVTFALALEKHREARRTRVLLVCSSGQASARLLQIQLQRNFGQALEVIDTCSLDQAKTYDYSHIDFVLTTLDIPFAIPVPILQTGFSLDQDTQTRIWETMNQTDTADLEEYFKEDLFFENLKAASREHALEQMSRRIVQQGYAPDGLTDLVMERELLGSTAITNKTALPHPTKMTGNQSVICTAILDHPIPWGSQEVQLVLMVSLHQQPAAKMDALYKGLTTLLKDRNKINRIIRTRTYTSLLHMAADQEET